MVKLRIIWRNFLQLFCIHANEASWEYSFTHNGILYTHYWGRCLDCERKKLRIYGG